MKKLFLLPLAAALMLVGCNGGGTTESGGGTVDPGKFEKVELKVANFGSLDSELGTETYVDTSTAKTYTASGYDWEISTGKTFGRVSTKYISNEGMAQIGTFQLKKQTGYFGNATELKAGAVKITVVNISEYNNSTIDKLVQVSAGASKDSLAAVTANESTLTPVDTGKVNHTTKKAEDGVTDVVDGDKPLYSYTVTYTVSNIKFVKFAASASNAVYFSSITIE